MDAPSISCPRCNGTGKVRDEAAFGASMKAKRTAAKVTLREVAAEMELSIGYVSDLEHGRKHWRGGLIIAYTDAVDRLAAPPRPSGRMKVEG